MDVIKHVLKFSLRNSFPLLKYSGQRELVEVIQKDPIDNHFHDVRVINFSLKQTYFTIPRNKTFISALC